MKWATWTPSRFACIVEAGRKSRDHCRQTIRCEGGLGAPYSPGSRSPALQVRAIPYSAYEYTAKGNLVAVICNGTAVLGLGNIGALAGKPVMEGKAVLFKRFADIDVFDLEVNTQDVDEFVRTVKLLEPTFGGVNLEDIKAPECFEIERQLKAEMSIPVFHDDQHGTAIISAAALLNAAAISGRELGSLKMVISGAGAAAVACRELYIKVGVDPGKIVVCDSRGDLPRPRRSRRQQGSAARWTPRRAPWPRPWWAATCSSACRSRAW